MSVVDMSTEIAFLNRLLEEARGAGVQVQDYPLTEVPHAVEETYRVAVWDLEASLPAHPYYESMTRSLGEHGGVVALSYGDLEQMPGYWDCVDTWEDDGPGPSLEGYLAWFNAETGGALQGKEF